MTHSVYANSQIDVRRNGMAYDRATVRSYDRDGRLRVGLANISKANVCGYYGWEVPEAAALGLDPNRLYQILRDPRELALGASTFNNVPLLSQHVAVTPDDPQPSLVVGATGSDAQFNDPYLQNSLVVWTADAIAGIVSGNIAQLSCAYRYRCVMGSGSHDGVRFDARMVDIEANHVCLVSEGRAGADVVVGDSAAVFQGRYADFVRNKLRFGGSYSVDDAISHASGKR